MGDVERCCCSQDAVGAAVAYAAGQGWPEPDRVFAEHWGVDSRSARVVAHAGPRPLWRIIVGPGQERRMLKVWTYGLVRLEWGGSAWQAKVEEVQDG